MTVAAGVAFTPGRHSSCSRPLTGMNMLRKSGRAVGEWTRPNIRPSACRCASGARPCTDPPPRCVRSSRGKLFGVSPNPPPLRLPPPQPWPLAFSPQYPPTPGPHTCTTTARPVTAAIRTTVSGSVSTRGRRPRLSRTAPASRPAVIDSSEFGYTVNGGAVSSGSSSGTFPLRSTAGCLTRAVTARGTATSGLPR